MPGPLAGVRILDLSTVISGPLAASHLVDQGADVIKVETLVGDISRRSRQKISENGQFSALFVSVNRGKRSIALDLKSPEGLEIVKSLAGKADVLLQNFRPGAIERLGLGEDALRASNQRLIYVSISGVGEGGPYAKKRIYDPIIQGLSGLADIQSNQDTQRPQMIRTILADKTTSIFTAQAITAALYAREKTGQGQHIRISLLDTMVGYLWPEGMMQFAVVGREKTASSTNSGPDLVFEALDGFLTVGTITDSEWQGFCTAVDRPDLLSDERFQTAESRSLNQVPRIRLMGEILKTRSRDEWLERLDRTDVPCAPVLRRNEILENPQVIANRLVETLQQPNVGEMRQARPAALFSRTPAAIQGPAPGLGEHTDAILREIGYSAESIAGLKSREVVANKS